MSVVLSIPFSSFYVNIPQTERYSEWNNSYGQDIKPMQLQGIFFKKSSVFTVICLNSLLYNSLKLELEYSSFAYSKASKTEVCFEVRVIFNNISFISWRSVLLVEETGVPGENHPSAVSHCQTLSHNVVSNTPRLIGISKCLWW